MFPYPKAAPAKPAPETDLKTLADAANEAAKREAAQWFFFVTIMLALAAIVGSTTHRALFLEEAVRVPVLGLDLPLLGFYFAVPAIFVVLHFYMLAQLGLMARKLATFLDELDRLCGPDRTARERALQRLDSFSVMQLLVGERYGSRRLTVLIMVWTTLVLAPVLLLLFFQLRFLPYHSEWITWWHRLLILADLSLIALLWPGRLVRRGGRGPWLRRVASAAAAAAVVFFSVVLSTIPDEATDRLAAALPGIRPVYSPSPFGWAQPRAPTILGIPVGDDRTVLDAVVLRRVLFDGEVDSVARRPRSLFARRLVLLDEDFVPEEDSRLVGLERTRSLRGRDLRDAVLDRSDLRKVDFAGADLRRASLAGARLDGASFRAADLRGVDLRGVSADRARFACIGEQAPLGSPDWRCTDLTGARLDRGRFRQASFHGARLRGASLADAWLHGAEFVAADLSGTTLEGAQLPGAWLGRAVMDAARLDRANLQGAILDEARLDGAILDRARLQAASLRGARLMGVGAEQVQLQAARLDSAVLHGVRFLDAQLQGASLRGASVWRVTAPPAAALADADYAELRHAPAETPHAPGAAQPNWNAWIMHLEALMAAWTKTDWYLIALSRLAEPLEPAEAARLRAGWRPSGPATAGRAEARLQAIACDPARHPAVLRGVARQLGLLALPAVEGPINAFGEVDALAPRLGPRLSNPETCPAAGGLDPQDLAEMRAFVRDQQPVGAPPR